MGLASKRLFACGGGFLDTVRKKVLPAAKSANYAVQHRVAVAGAAPCDVDGKGGNSSAGHRL